MDHPEIQMECFCLRKWFENLNSFKTDFQFRADNEFHVIHAERGFYYLLSMFTDLPVLREALYYVVHLCQQPTGFKNFDDLILKNVNLLIDHYNSCAVQLHVNIDDVFAEEEVAPYIEYRTNAVQHLRNLESLDGVIAHIKRTCVDNPLELPWHLVTINNFDQRGAIVYIAEAEKIFSNIIFVQFDEFMHSYDYEHKLIQRLETIGADFAFYSKVLTPNMAKIFMDRISNVRDYNGWHANYCENILSRLIFPILNISEDGFKNIDKHSFRNMLLLFLQMYRKKNQLVMFDTQLKRALRLFVGNELENEMIKFRAALKNLGWSGKSVDKYPWQI